MKQYLLKVWMTAALSLLVVGGVWGQTAPTVVSLSPVDNTTELPVGTSNFVMTFSVAIEFNPTGIYAIDLYNSDQTRLVRKTIWDGDVGPA